MTQEEIQKSPVFQQNVQMMLAMFIEKFGAIEDRAKENDSLTFVMPDSVVTLRAIKAPPEQQTGLVVPMGGKLVPTRPKLTIACEVIDCEPIVVSLPLLQPWTDSASDAEQIVNVKGDYDDV